MTNDSSKPFNPWPGSIIAVFAVAVVAAVVWVAFCLRHGSDLVAADYYEQEVEYQQQLNRLERGQALGQGASISYDPAPGTIRIRLPQTQAALQPSGMVHFYRPSEATLDHTLPLELDAAGEQRVDAAPLKPGLWEVRVQWSVGGEDYLLKEKVQVVDRAS